MRKVTKEVDNEFNGELTSSMAKEIDSNLYSNEPKDKDEEENKDNRNIESDSTVPIPNHRIQYQQKRKMNLLSTTFQQWRSQTT